MKKVRLNEAQLRRLVRGMMAEAGMLPIDHEGAWQAQMSQK